MGLWLPRLVHLRSELLLAALRDRAAGGDLAALSRFVGVLPGAGTSLDGRVDAAAVSEAVSLLDADRVFQFITSTCAQARRVVSLSDRLELVLPEELATHRACRAEFYQRLVEGDLQSLTGREARRLVVMVDESDSMDVTGPGGLAAVVWAHALVEVIAPDRAVCFGGGKAHDFVPGWRLGGQSDATPAWGLLGPEDDVVLLTDGRIGVSTERDNLDRNTARLPQCVIGIPSLISLGLRHEARLEDFLRH